MAVASLPANIRPYLIFFVGYEWLQMSWPMEGEPQMMSHAAGMLSQSHQGLFFPHWCSEQSCGEG